MKKYQEYVIRFYRSRQFVFQLSARGINVITGDVEAEAERLTEKDAVEMVRAYRKLSGWRTTAVMMHKPTEIAS